MDCMRHTSATIGYGSVVTKAESTAKTFAPSYGCYKLPH